MLHERTTRLQLYGPLPRSRRDGTPLREACAAGVAALLLLGGCVDVPPRASTDAMTARAALAESERAFAHMGATAGVHDAFIAYFAPDGLAFEPAPVRVRDAFPARPPAPQPPTRRLEWEPALVEVASSEDLGYSTGPFRLVDQATAEIRATGAFFSVWQRQPDGQWRVWLDMGARTDAPVDAPTWQVRPHVPPGARGANPEAVTPAALAALDRALSGLEPAAFATRLAVDARRHADASVPLVGEAWVAMLDHEGASATYTPVEARVAAAGDFAAVHGRFAWRATPAQPGGRYVHVWLRSGGDWRLAVETIVDDE